MHKRSAAPPRRGRRARRSTRRCSEDRLVLVNPCRILRQRLNPQGGVAAPAGAARHPAGQAQPLEVGNRPLREVRKRSAAPSRRGRRARRSTRRCSEDRLVLVNRRRVLRRRSNPRGGVAATCLCQSPPHPAAAIESSGRRSRPSGRSPASCRASQPSSVRESSIARSAQTVRRAIAARTPRPQEHPQVLRGSRPKGSPKRAEQGWLGRMAEPQRVQCLSGVPL